MKSNNNLGGIICFKSYIFHRVYIRRNNNYKYEMVDIDHTKISSIDGSIFKIFDTKKGDIILEVSFNKDLYPENINTFIMGNNNMKTRINVEYREISHIIKTLKQETKFKLKFIE
ncbi:hypothetical protein [Romboutsia ilealis]|uniref:hypothetical protein n=1 Tax=Romboutsia ilealis TaxID=1115758 RepID=UPI00272CDAE4|nr:hypothetical protein [Romboutsia ilealis]